MFTYEIWTAAQDKVKAVTAVLQGTRDEFTFADLVTATMCPPSALVVILATLEAQGVIQHRDPVHELPHDRFRWIAKGPATELGSVQHPTAVA